MLHCERFSFEISPRDTNFRVERSPRALLFLRISWPTLIAISGILCFTSIFQGYTPEYCAQQIVNAIRDRKTDFIMAQTDARIAVFLRYLWPALLNYMLYIRGTKDQWAPKSKKNWNLSLYFLLWYADKNVVFIVYKYSQCSKVVKW